MNEIEFTGEGQNEERKQKKIDDVQNPYFCLGFQDFSDYTSKGSERNVS